MQVEQKISQLLIAYLRRYRRVAVDGIGTFLVEEVPAYLDESTNTLFPPTCEVKLYQTISKDRRLTSLIQSAHVGALDDLTEFYRHIDESLATKDVVKLTDFGCIRRSADGFDFSSDKALGTKIVPAYPTITLSQKMKETSKHLEAPNIESVVKKAHPEKFKVDDQPNQSWTHYLLPLLILVAGILLMAFMYRSCGGSKVEQSPIPAKQQPSQEEHVVKSDDPARAKMDTLMQLLESIGPGEKCMINVGSYTKPDNAKVLQAKVSRLGFDTEVLLSDKVWRVAVTFDCQEHDLLNYLLYVQEKIHTEAWYLVPRVDQDELETILMKD